MPKPKNPGERSRFSGFWLGESERDRVVAEWINEQPNAAESIKALIYAAATGKLFGTAMGASAPAEEERPQLQLDVNDPRVRALASLDT